MPPDPGRGERRAWVRRSPRTSPRGQLRAESFTSCPRVGHFRLWCGSRIEDPESIDPGLLLFAVFVVHGLAEDTTAAGGASVAVG